MQMLDVLHHSRDAVTHLDIAHSHAVLKEFILS